MSNLEFRPSKADRLVACPNSVLLCRTVPEPPASSYAAEGTRLHEVAAKVLTAHRELQPTEVITESVSREDFDMVSPYLYYIAAFKNYPVRIEKRVEIIPGAMAGTLDADILHDEWIEVVDLKTGAGVTVQPDTWQGRCYAIGSFKDNAKKYAKGKLKGVKFTIVQPRAKDGQPIKSVEYTVDDLIEFILTLEHAIDQVRRNDNMDPQKLDYYVGKHCRWCPAAEYGMCRAVTEQLDKDLRIQDAMGETLGELVRRFMEVYEPLKTRLYARAQDELEKGYAVPGLKLVPKRSQRRWVDDEQAVAWLESALGEQAYNRKALSPAQAEKLVKLPEGYVESHSSGHTLALDDDPRENVESSPLMRFGKQAARKQ